MTWRDVAVCAIVAAALVGLAAVEPQLAREALAALAGPAAYLAHRALGKRQRQRDTAHTGDPGNP